VNRVIAGTSRGRRVSRARTARILLALLALVSGCSDAPDKAPTIPALDAQPITYMDIEAARLTGPSCNYAPGHSMGAVVMAMNDEAVMKIGGALKRFTLDPQ
jgi:hypothetical protein